MANNPYVNKVVYGQNTLIDLSGDNVSASDVAQGKIFHLPTGQQSVGTATGGGSGDGYVWQDAQGYVHLSDEPGTSISVEALSVTQNGTYTAPTGTAYSPVTVNVSGGGGLVYETGTWIPTADIARPTISFTNSHGDIPILIMMTDATGNDEPTSNTNLAFYFMYQNDVFGYPFYQAEQAPIYGIAYCRYKASASASSGAASNLLYPKNSTGSTTSFVNYFVTASEFYPYAASTTRYWRAGRTYKWIAVWAPTT